MYLVFTRMPGDSYRRRFRSLLFYLRYVFGVLINSLVCWFSLPLDQKRELSNFRREQTWREKNILHLRLCTILSLGLFLLFLLLLVLPLPFLGLFLLAVLPFFPSCSSFFLSSCSSFFLSSCPSFFSFLFFPFSSCSYSFFFFFLFFFLLLLPVLPFSSSCASFFLLFVFPFFLFLFFLFLLALLRFILLGLLLAVDRALNSSK